MDYDEYVSNDKTFADYNNFRNLLFVQSQELTRVMGELRTSNKNLYRINMKLFRKNYSIFFPQINSREILGHLDKEQTQFLRDCYTDLNKITLNKAYKITNIVMHLMHRFGIYNISKAGGEDEL